VAANRGHAEGVTLLLSYMDPKTRKKALKDDLPDCAKHYSASARELLRKFSANGQPLNASTLGCV
jgi:hypothetical protein